MVKSSLFGVNHEFIKERIACSLGLIYILRIVTMSRLLSIELVKMAYYASGSAQNFGNYIQFKVDRRQIIVVT